jgi:hypothetical protein
VSAVVVTGSRVECDTQYVWAQLDCADIAYAILGDCPTGVDANALAWCIDRGVPYELHRADWRAHGRAAGPKRNADMVRAGVLRSARVLAFPRGAARGTGDCIRQALRAGLEVTEV